jgi:3-deoxy-D-manno-octulosonic acid hydroxylase-like protein
MHVDAFPSRPTNGDRILRLFTNIHPSQDRVWISGGDFERLVERYALSSGILGAIDGKNDKGALAGILRAAGLRKGRRSAYDEFMLRFHDFLKENEDFQKTAPREQFSFPPGSTWLVFTDGVSHAVLSGRHALEQTFLIARDSLVSSHSAPISILERLAGRKLSLGAAA